MVGTWTPDWRWSLSASATFLDADLYITDPTVNAGNSLQYLLMHPRAQFTMRPSVRLASTLDLDGTVLRTGLQVAWARRGYNPHHPTHPSYYTLLAHLAQTGQIIRVKNRPGNVNDSYGATGVIREIVAADSFKLGVIRLTERFVKSDPLSGRDERKLVRHIEDELSKYLRMAEKEEVVITRHGKAAGVLIGFKSEDDWFEYRLEHHPEFLTRVSEARRSIAAGSGVRLEAV